MRSFSQPGINSLHSKFYDFASLIINFTFVNASSKIYIDTFFPLFLYKKKEGGEEKSKMKMDGRRKREEREEGSEKRRKREEKKGGGGKGEEKTNKTSTSTKTSLLSHFEYKVTQFSISHLIFYKKNF